MKKTLLLCLCAALTLSCNSTLSSTDKNQSTQPIPPDTKGKTRILMIGNSHTEFYVSLPDMLESLCAANGHDVTVDRVIDMGASLNEIIKANADNADRLFAFTDADGNYYDYIILQEKTSVVLSDPETYLENCRHITAMVRKNSPKAVLYIYEVMSPVPYLDKERFKETLKLSHDRASMVTRSLNNAGVLHIGDKIAEAYAGKNGYQYTVGGNDALRFGDNTLHMLNDAGYLSTIYTYKTLFGRMPAIPKQLPLCSGTGDEDEIELHEVDKVISNPGALTKIAED